MTEPIRSMVATTGVALCAAGLLLVSGWARADDNLYHEPFRPQFHFSPPQQWMNDPNGLVYAAGEYHLFYQYNPYSNKWGPMHWGHATSSDLVHWDNLPIALFPDVHGAIFSGSAVLDAANSSGFGSGIGRPPLVAMFTYHDLLSARLGKSGFQSQGLAYSLDGGARWRKYPRNPVLVEPDSRDFRDPNVTWHAATRRWVAAVAAGNHVAFYSSRDLRHWTYESEFGALEGAHGGTWECPVLARMPVEGTHEIRYVLLVSINPGGPNGGSATQYFVGTFDGHRFTPEPQPVGGAATDARWVDYGTDDYAGSTWSGGAPGDERVLFIGWMDNWLYANDVPTTRWRGAMTLPRVLRLVRAPQGLELRSEPVAELASLRRKAGAVSSTHFAGEMDLLRGTGVSAKLLEMEIELDMAGASQASLVLSNGRGEQVVLGIDLAALTLSIDRSRSGEVGFNPSFASVQEGKLSAAGGVVKVHLFLDASSIEVFANDGATVMTTVVFPTVPYDSIVLRADHELPSVSATAYELSSVWH